jgi:hypothetical protein
MRPYRHYDISQVGQKAEKLKPSTSLPVFRSERTSSRLNTTVRAREGAAIPIPASSPFQQSVNPRWRHPNCFRALPLGSAELLRFGEIFRRVAKLFLAGLDCAPRFVVQLGGTRASFLQCARIKNKVSLFDPCFPVSQSAINP